MVSFLDAATESLRQAYCLATDRLGVYGEMYLGGENPIGGAAIGAANFLHNLACDRPPPAATVPPFTGGQCSTLYNVQISWSGTRSSPPTSGIGTAFGVKGAVTGASFERTGNDVTFYVFGQPNPPSNTTGKYSAGGIANYFISGASIDNVSVTSVTRQDGSPDNCGNPPSVRPPYTPGDNVVNTNITYNNSNNTSVTVPVVIAFGYAKVDVNGVLNIPFTLNAPITPVLNITGNLNLNTGQPTFNTGNPRLPPSSCGGNSDDFSPDPDDSLPTSPVSPDVPDPDPTQPKPQTRKLMVGAIVTVTEVPPQITIIPQGSNPDIYAPDAGTISFQVSVGGRTGWTEDLRVKNQRQFIPCPWKGGAIAVAGTPRLNGAMTVTPVYEKVTLGETYPA